MIRITLKRISPRKAQPRMAAQDKIFNTSPGFLEQRKKKERRERKKERKKTERRQKEDRKKERKNERMKERMKERKEGGKEGGKGRGEEDEETLVLTTHTVKCAAFYQISLFMRANKTPEVPDVVRNVWPSDALFTFDACTQRWWIHPHSATRAKGRWEDLRGSQQPSLNDANSQHCTSLKDDHKRPLPRQAEWPLRRHITSGRNTTHQRNNCPQRKKNDVASRRERVLWPQDPDHPKALNESIPLNQTLLLARTPLFITTWTCGQTRFMKAMRV